MLDSRSKYLLEQKKLPNLLFRVVFIWIASPNNLLSVKGSPLRNLLLT